MTIPDLLETLRSNNYSAQSLEEIGTVIISCDQVEGFEKYCIIIRGVCFDVAEEWTGGKPVMGERADFIKESLLIPIESLLEAIEQKNATECERLVELLSGRLFEYLKED